MADDSKSPVWCEYLSWLTFAVPGMLDTRNVDAMDHALRSLPGNAPLVEIGSFCGLSTSVLSFLKRRHRLSNPLITCDSWAFEGKKLGHLLHPDVPVTHDEYRRFVMESFRRNVSTFCRPDLPHTVERDSQAFAADWASAKETTDVFGRATRLGGPISFCYIDGCHAYPAARADFDFADRFLLPGGFILLDDSGDGSGWEVCRVVQEVIAGGHYEVVSHNPNYLLRKR